jgi:MYXO-CTERM domain-containing protein
MISPSRRLATALICAALAPATATAQSYVFDNMCAPVTRHEVGRLAPNVLAILDQSGSMSSNNKWNIAKNALKEIADSTYRAGTCNATVISGCDEIRLGLGFFSTSASVAVLPAEDTRDSVKNALDSRWPGGGTNMYAGTLQILNSNELKATDRTGIGMFITDGEPSIISLDGTTISSSIPAAENLCTAKNRVTGPAVTYVVGFGSGANPYINSMLAAAGGTGTCRTSGGAVIDVCGLSRADKLKLQNKQSPYNGATCTGSLQADNAQALKDALLSITTNAACTFPLTIPPNYPAGAGADADPFATRVAINHRIYGQNVEVQPYLANDPNLFYTYLVNARGVAPAAADIMKGDGWVFADQTRKNIRFTPDLCAQIGAGNITVVDTQVACLCQFTGQPCVVPGKLGVCRQGVWACVGGRDVCQQVNQPSAETCNNLDDNCDGLVDNIPNAGQACSVPGQLGRCALGNIACVAGAQVCQQRFAPMPETCNGLDDNCDGQIDDLSDARSRDPVNWTANILPAQYSGLVCAFQDSCTCTQAMARANTHQGDTLNAYLAANWAQKCRCAEGIFEASDDLTVEAAPHADANADEELAGCAVASPTQDAQNAQLGLIGLTLLGAVVGRRRRR